MQAADPWDPATYDRFETERNAPFFDLLGLLQRDRPIERVADLGCGTGRLSRVLHEQTGARETIGVDSSASMLAKARAEEDERLVAKPARQGERSEPPSTPKENAGGLSFAGADIADPRALDERGLRDLDVVFSNATYQWIPHHVSALADAARRLRPGGQLAVQVPANGDHPSHAIARDVANESPFVEAYRTPPTDSVTAVLAPERYAELLHDWGFADQQVRLQVYGHLLDSTEAVVTWVRGTLLHRYLEPLPIELHERFRARYRDRLLEAVGDQRPYFYAFKRILFWGRLPT